jgi:hypothetical protein
MDFFKDLGKNLGKTAKTVTKKSEELVEITKLKLNIGNEEDKIKKLLVELGSDLYGRFAKGEVVDECFNAKCVQIKSIEDSIEALREKIRSLKGNNNTEISTDCNINTSEEVNSEANYRLDNSSEEEKE